MKDGKSYFTQQEEEISNKYMSANGEGDNYSNLTGMNQYFRYLKIAVAVTGVATYLSYKKFGAKGILYPIGGLLVLSQLINLKIIK
tara:strand:- start:103 stop:360 length:258 start_codon:yes stop_codon:yes gene_type:complete